MKTRPYPIYATYNRGPNIKREPDFEFEGISYWWKEMTSKKEKGQPIKIQHHIDLDVILYRDGGWGVEAPKEVLQEYKNWCCERHLLELDK